MKRLLRSKSGAVEIEAIASILILVMFLVLALNVFTLLSRKQDLDYFAKEITTIAAFEGRTNGKVLDRYKQLCEETGMEPDISWNTEYFNSAEKTIQLGDPIQVILTYHTNLTGFGAADMPLQLTAKHSAISEKYWKAGD